MLSAQSNAVGVSWIILFHVTWQRPLVWLHTIERLHGDGTSNIVCPPLIVWLPTQWSELLYMGTGFKAIRPQADRP